jgi:Zn-dependent protease with chaperone function
LLVCPVLFLPRGWGGRIFTFLGTNLAVLSVLFQVFGVEQWLYREGANINVQGLLFFSALFGMGGSFISLALSKWLAKSGMGMGYFLTTIVAQIFLSILASMIVMAFSRWREYRADDGGARLAEREN